MVSGIKQKNFKVGSRCAIKGGEGFHGSKHRISVLVFFIFVVVIAVITRLYFLQIFSYDAYRALAEGQHTLFKNLIPTRGEIFLKDKDGLYPAAVNQNTKMAYAVPKEIENPNETARVVAEVLQADRAELEEKFNQPEDMYEVLKHRLSEEEIQKINDAKLSGIHLADESFRYYPSGELAANVLGFVGWRDKDFGGRYGAEAYFETKLKGADGQITQKRDAAGTGVFAGGKGLLQARDGDNIVLTIDHTVQYETEKLLKAAVEKNEADSGSIIVMEPRTGRILSMANYPTFDPNNYTEVEDIAVYRNTTVSEAYESGSVFKAITMAAGLDSGMVNPDTTYSDTGSVKEAGYTIKNSDLKANGVQTMTEVLEKSLNTGVIYVEKLVGNKNFADYVRRFGFGELTGADIVGEAGGNINNLKNLKSDIQFFTASFGQGITVTPIQLAAAYNAIANGGVLMKPQIVDRIVHPDGNGETVEPQEVRRVISEKAAILLGQMLQSVVINGHGKQAGVPGYLISGKTGTAQVASTDSRGYEQGTNIGSFAGFAPTNDPRFTILVRVNNPRTVQWAESSAAPAFGELMKFLLDYYNIEPTEKYTQVDLDKFNATHNLNSYFIKKAKEKTDDVVLTAAPADLQKDKKKED
ncbi:MAG: penicillin-binding protein 2 [Parcubacteria group bacterium]|jgi:cell division protein FtsI/penicillin-binding protein 2